METIVINGISGSGSKQFCDRYGRFREENYVEGKTMVFHTGDMIYNFAQNPRLPQIPKENFLNLEPERLSGARDRAFEAVLEERNQDYVRVIVDTHARFFCNHVFSNAFDAHYLMKLDPDLFLTIIDDPFRIKKRQMQTPEGRAQNHRIEEILYWQNEEIETTRSMADLLRKPHYVLPSSQNPEIVESLLENEFSIYFSIPMTDAKSEARERIDEFEGRLLKLGEGINAVPTPVIRPIEIEETWKVPEELKEVVDRHTIYTDADVWVPSVTHVVVYYPSGAGISKGVSDESVRGYRGLGKYVYVVDVGRKKKSPFMGLATGVFGKEKDFFNFFEEHMKEKMKALRRG